MVDILASRPSACSRGRQRGIESQKDLDMMSTVCWGGHRIKSSDGSRGFEFNTMAEGGQHGPTRRRVQSGSALGAD